MGSQRVGHDWATKHSTAHVVAFILLYTVLSKLTSDENRVWPLEEEDVSDVYNRNQLWVLVAFTCVQLFATPWARACQAPQSMQFFRQEHWNGLPFHSPKDLPDPGIEPWSPAFQADSLPSEPPKPRVNYS